MRNETTSRKYNRSYNEFISSRPAMRGTISVEHDYYYDNHDFENPHPHRASYSMQDVSFWIPSLQRWIPATQEYIIHAETLELAKNEFWKRLNTYLIRRFKSRICIEITQ